MKKAILYYNPEAGSENHSKDELLALTNEAGLKCKYVSAKDEEWKKIHTNAELIVIAGGDGTIRKIVKKIIQQPRIETPIPIIVIPLGTANNIARSQNYDGHRRRFIQMVDRFKSTPFDVGRIRNISNENFFIESTGFGIFPLVMSEMKAFDEKLSDDPERRKTKALELCAEICQDMKCEYYSIEIDGKDFSGEYFLAEVMNIPSLGANITLARQAVQGDGYFDVVLLKELDRKKFLNYISRLADGKSSTFHTRTIKAKKIRIKSKSTLLHVDDKLIKLKHPRELQAEMREGLIQALG